MLAPRKRTACAGSEGLGRSGHEPAVSVRVRTVMGRHESGQYSHMGVVQSCDRRHREATPADFGTLHLPSTRLGAHGISHRQSLCLPRYQPTQRSNGADAVGPPMTKSSRSSRLLARRPSRRGVGTATTRTIRSGRTTSGFTHVPGYYEAGRTADTRYMWQRILNSLFGFQVSQVAMRKMSGCEKSFCRPYLQHANGFEPLYRCWRATAQRVHPSSSGRL